MKYRIDKKYTYLESKVVNFFSGYLKHTLTKDEKVPLNHLDFVVYDKNSLIVGAEIKSYKETSTSASSWYSYHVNTSKMIDPNGIHQGVEDLPVSARGFVATIDGQLRMYVQRLDIKDIWLVQEERKFYKDLLLALSFLEDRSRLEYSRIYNYGDICLLHICFAL